MGMIKEFKEFAMRGSVVDLAVGVIIGAAFGKIVTSLVDDMIMPIVGFITGGIDFSYMKYVIKEGDAANNVPDVAIMYGNFINVVVQFLIVAFVIFLVIKGINSLQRKNKAEEPAPIPGPTQEELLAEIRDLLKK
ncbi:large-conductance mechanosensitive channel protein MscL [Albibacterium bauzanense]|uniref:Large-conductance mechanosensitive channel n=1 Tax=Albibacterium bauzanense TaxID=653929 RepID=A0A4R1LVN9_9SPHI|nr:large-conductance mechanosensitive channel protein MscL [Albibacterium bauzanense]TCK83496.1 large conductance mechanosensitive channel [Albibacterium bauzanense]